MIDCADVSREFPTRHGVVHGLDHVSLSVSTGQFVTVKGPSGSGKSTLLLALGGMQRPSHGSVRIDGTDLYSLPPSGRADFRARKIGFVFQMFHLLSYLDALENTLTGLPPGTPAAPARKSAVTLLERLGLGDRLSHKPAALSAGERQRVALARALLKRPPLVLADEPTGNLDPGNARQVFEHLAAYHRAGGTVIVVTHGTDADGFATRALRLERGRLADDSAPTPSPQPGQNRRIGET